MKEKTLETLKDIKLDYERESNIRRNIKKEAIKWVKEKGWKLNREDFMEMHNITEDNLK